MVIKHRSQLSAESGTNLTQNQHCRFHRRSKHRPTTKNDKHVLTANAYTHICTKHSQILIYKNNTSNKEVIKKHHPKHQRQKIIPTCFLLSASSLTARAHNSCWASAKRSNAAGSSRWATNNKQLSHATTRPCFRFNGDPDNYGLL